MDDPSNRQNEPELLLRFLAVRVAVPAAILAVLSFFADWAGPLAALGVLLGAFLSLYRLRLFARVLGALLPSRNRTRSTVLSSILSLILLFALLIAAILVSLNLFLGVTAGLLLVPLMICVNAATERLGITNNCWGCGKGGIDWKK